MSTSEIAKLESRWRDNPHGLTFAPLAEAYRKQKDPRRALEILLPGLERHPDYIPANIVLGRCHWDLNDLEGAEKAFTHVLALDAENVIALKALADITERQSRPFEAERWLEMLLAVDRSNDEAREQLVRIRAVQSVSPVLETPAGLDVSTADLVFGGPVAVPAIEPPVFASPEPQRDPAVEEPAAVEPGAVEPAAAEPAAVEPAPALAGPGDTYPDQLDPFPAIADQLASPAATAPDETDARWSSSGSSTELAPTVFPDLGDFPPSITGQPAAAASHEPTAEASPDGEGYDFERAEDIVLSVGGESEFHRPNAAEELVAADPASGLAETADAAEPFPERDRLAEEPPPAAALFGSYFPNAAAASYEPPSFEAPAYEPPAYEPPVAESPPAGEPAAGVPSEFRAAPEPQAAYGAEPDLVVTETMAQVFLRQGYVLEALAVYRELVARDPGAPHLHDRVAELEARHAAAATPPPRPSLLARDTGGQPLGAFLAGVLAARLEPVPPTAGSQVDGEVMTPDAAPATRPAEEPLSLGSVFGEDPPPVAPAVPPPGVAPAPIPDESSRAVSFDEFFAGSPVSAPAPAPAPRASRPRSDDDLDQFHSWLQSLKR
jgi:tetratricopeptide (TPR) repeat protein